MLSASKCFLESRAMEVMTDWLNEDVIIVVPPFASSRSPLLGPSILLDACLKAGIKCRVFYANLAFAAGVTPNFYEKIAGTDHHFINEAIFAPYAFDLQKDELARFVQNCQDTNIANHWGRANMSPADYLNLDSVIPAFLAYIVKRIAKANPSIVGFSALSKQVTASLAIAKWLKAIAPGIVTVMGGNSVTRPMGDAISSIAPMIDYLFAGEAEVRFPRFCREFLLNRSLPVSKIIDCQPVTVMDSLGIPDFDDYFQQLRPLQDEGLMSKDWALHIPFESSRGCWWGEKRTCAFCGFDISNIRYRSKSGERIVSEIARLTGMYPGLSIEACDSVMPRNFEQVLSKLAPLKARFSIYQVRPTLEPAVMDLCVKAGITAVAAGVESLSTNILRKLGKGVTALQNLKLLREARSRRMYIWWNFLVGIPGETEEDYESILQMLPCLEHLQPPTGIGRIAINRYSRYHCNPVAFGIRSVRPVAAYRLIYPANANLQDLAYTFDADFESILSRDLDLCRRLRARCSEWIRSWEGTKERPSLCTVETTDRWRVIKDTRRVARETYTPVDGQAENVLEFLAEPARRTSVPKTFRRGLADLLDRRFVIHYEDHYMSLVTRPILAENSRLGGGAMRPANDRQRIVLPRLKSNPARNISEDWFN